MYTRQNELNQWLKQCFAETPVMLTPLAGDASFRRYFRLYSDAGSHIVMDAPPDKESVSAFLQVAHRLAAIGVHTPAIVAADEARGFILLEDLGDQLLFSIVSEENADTLYLAAIKTLLQLQQCPTTGPALPDFDTAHMLKELNLFREWFLDSALGLTLNSHEDDIVSHTFDWLITQLSAQPQVFIHRDYHSRNLLVVGDIHTPDIGVIDFQDAMRGPLTYDLVSLLKDCYIQWPRERLLQWLKFFHEQSSHSASYSQDAFIRAFDLCGLQRHLKVLGIFCRLHLRDNKDGYLRDLPLTFHYMNACCESYSELQPFYQLIQHRVYPRFAEKYL